MRILSASLQKSCKKNENIREETLAYFELSCTVHTVCYFGYITLPRDVCLVSSSRSLVKWKHSKFQPPLGLVFLACLTCKPMQRNKSCLAQSSRGRFLGSLITFHSPIIRLRLSKEKTTMFSRLKTCLLMELKGKVWRDFRAYSKTQTRHVNSLNTCRKTWHLSTGFLDNFQNDLQSYNLALTLIIQEI